MTSKELEYQTYLVSLTEDFVSDEEAFIDSWTARYRLFVNNGWDVENLPEMLARLAIQFRSGIRIKEQGWRRNNLICNYHEISGGTICVISGNGTLHNSEFNDDHRWPESLGGVKDPSNQLDLCKLHNMAKMNGLWGYNWTPDTVPVWIIDVLKQMNNHFLLRIGNRP